MSLIWQLIIIELVVFCLIILFLRWLLYSHIHQAMRRLQRLNQENLEKEKALKEEFERAKKEAQREVETGRQEAEKIKMQAKEEAEKAREELLDKTRKESKRLIAEAVRDCQRKQVELTGQMQSKAVYLATDMIKYIFSKEVKENLHLQLIDELIAEMEKLDEQKLKEADNKAQVILSHSLTDAQRNKLQKVLSAKLKKEVTLSENLDEDIVAGLVVKLGGFVIDGSVSNKIRKVLPMMKEKAKLDVPQEQGNG